jgi:hypothetical protein
MGRPVQSLIHAANTERFSAPVAAPTELETRLDQACRVLTAGSLSAAQSLLSQLRHKGSLSEKQYAFARSLCDRAKPVAAPAPKAPSCPPVQGREKIALGDFAGMIALFDKAAAQKSSKAYLPKVRLLCEGEKIELTVAGSSARNPGTINVSTPGGRDNNTWFGRILRTGEFEVNPRVTVPGALKITLGEFARNPLDSMVSFGRLTGQCSICARKLVDPVSIDRGIGPICAAKWGF